MARPRANRRRYGPPRRFRGATRGRRSAPRPARRAAAPSDRQEDEGQAVGAAGDPDRDKRSGLKAAERLKPLGKVIHHKRGYQHGTVNARSAATKQSRNLDCLGTAALDCFASLATTTANGGSAAQTLLFRPGVLLDGGARVREIAIELRQGQAGVLLLIGAAERHAEL